MRQAKLLFGETDQVRGEDDAAGMAGPVIDIQCGVELSQVRVTTVTENTLHEIQVTDQVAGCKETDFHGFFRILAGYFGTHDGSQQK